MQRKHVLLSIAPADEAEPLDVSTSSSREFGSSANRFKAHPVTSNSPSQQGTPDRRTPDAIHEMTDEQQDAAAKRYNPDYTPAPTNVLGQAPSLNNVRPTPFG